MRQITLMMFAIGCLCGACKEERLGISGTLEPHRVLVSAEMSGRLVEVNATETQTVKAGDTLARFACDTPEAQHQQAQAALRVAEAQQALTTAGARPQEVALAQAQVEIAQQQLDIALHGATKDQRRQLQASLSALQARTELAQQNIARQESLQKSGTGNAAALDTLRAELRALEAERTRLRAQLSEATGGARPEQQQILEQQLSQARDHLLLVQEGPRPEAATVAAAQVELAQTQVRLSEEALTRCRVLAPVGGRIARVDYLMGEWALGGAPLFAIDTDAPWTVRTYAAQQWLGTISPGREMTVTVDGAPGIPALRARVLTISDQPEFTAGNVQTPDERILLVYRLDLELIDPPPSGLRAGMTVIVTPPAGGVSP